MTTKKRAKKKPAPKPRAKKPSKAAAKLGTQIGMRGKKLLGMNEAVAELNRRTEEMLAANGDHFKPVQIEEPSESPVKREWAWRAAVHAFLRNEGMKIKLGSIEVGYDSDGPDYAAQTVGFARRELLTFVCLLFAGIIDDYVLADDPHAEDRPDPASLEKWFNEIFPERRANEVTHTINVSQSIEQIFGPYALTPAQKEIVDRFRDKATSLFNVPPNREEEVRAVYDPAEQAKRADRIFGVTSDELDAMSDLQMYDLIPRAIVRRLKSIKNPPADLSEAILNVPDEHRGYKWRRFVDFPGELAFAEAWMMINDSPSPQNAGALEFIVGDDLSERDRVVAATLMQWLGSQVGQQWLDNAQRMARQRAARAPHAHFKHFGLLGAHSEK